MEERAEESTAPPGRPAGAVLSPALSGGDEFASLGRLLPVR